MFDWKEPKDIPRTKTNLNKKTKDELDKHSFVTYLAEKYNFYSKRTNDMFSCIDLISFYKDDTYLIQVCNKSNRSSRYKKLIVSKELKEITKDSNNHFVLLYLWDRIGDRWDYSVEFVNNNMYECI